MDVTAELLAAVNGLRATAGLAPLHGEPALASVAREAATEARASGPSSYAERSDPVAVSRAMRRAGYRPHVWRQRLVQGPANPQELLQHWRETDPATYAQVVLGDFDALGAARSAGADPPLWALFVALPQVAWERQLAEPLDDLDSVRAAILAQVNAARAREGLASLTPDPRLAAAAQAYAREMLAGGFYAHRSPAGLDPGDRARAAGYAYRWIGENLAKGLFARDEVVGRWMGSSGHRRNILDRHAEHAGIGVAWGTDRRGDVQALWVLLLGAER